MPFNYFSDNHPKVFIEIFGTFASMLPQKPELSERFRKESEYAETPS